MSYHHGDLRNALLQAAEKLLNEEGIAGLSLRQVAREAGVSHTAPYRHFADKSDLLAALAQAGFERLEAELSRAERAYPEDPGAQLSKAGVVYVTLMVSHPETAKLMYGGAIDIRTAVAPLKEAAQKAAQAFTRIVANGQKAGLYQEAETKVLAAAAWSLVHGIAMLISGGFLRAGEGTGISVEELTGVISRVLRQGMAKRDQLTPPSGSPGATKVP